MSPTSTSRWAAGTQRSYDALGRVSEEISRSGLQTRYTYGDEHGNVLTKTEHATGIDYIWQYGYDESDNLLDSIDPRNHRVDQTACTS